MLVGRERERQAIRALVAGARVGQGSAVVLTGEAGMGKSSLLADARDGAGGVRVLTATGSETESEVAFAALLQLLRPALVHLGRIPSPQADALASALALRPGRRDDRFAVGAATLSLLSRFAEDRPLLVTIDDAHLLDLASAQALTFACRRLSADPVVVLATVRDGQSGPFTSAGLPELALTGLSLPETAELVAAGGRHLGGEALARLHDLTGGNPFAVVELVDEADLPGAGPPDAPVPVPTSLVRAFGRRLDQLSAPARTAALVAAAGGSDLGLVAAACRLLGVDVAALTEAEDAGLLAVAGGAVAFRHNLVRSAVWSDAPAGTRRTVHRALAECIPLVDAERRAWHLGEAVLGPDEDVARTLAQVAAGAGSRSAHAVASRAYERAAHLSPGTRERVERLVAAGDAAWQAGMGERAVGLLVRAAALDPARPVSAAIAGLRGRIASRTGPMGQARDLLLEAAAATAATDADETVMLLADAVLAGLFLGDTATVADVGARLPALLAGAGSAPARLVGALAVGVAGVLTGREGPEQIRRALHAVVPSDALLADPRVAPWLVIGPLFLRESGPGRDLMEEVVESLRRRSVVGGLPVLLFYLGRDQATTDRWDLAESSYAESIQLAREAEQEVDLGVSLAGLAWLAARQGREADCRAHAHEAARLCEEHGIALFGCWPLAALGELELGLGRPAAAIEQLQHLEAALAGLRLRDVDLSPAPELVDALVRVGREDEARERAGRYAALAEAKGQPWALARSARAAGLVAPDELVDEHFARAAALHAQTPDAFEAARTQLSYGSRLRRSRHRVASRSPLRAALATFEALGARPWADQAAAELAATGDTAVRRGAPAQDALTPQELQVARMLAGGRTTREAAAALFLSPKTVEHHLRHVYVKLGIRSRAELAEELGQRPSRLR